MRDRFSPYMVLQSNFYREGNVKRENLLADSAHIIKLSFFYPKKSLNFSTVIPQGVLQNGMGFGFPDNFNLIYD